MNIIEIYNALQNGDHSEENEQCIYKPEHTTLPVAPKLNLPTKLTKNQRAQLSKVLAFIDMKKYSRIANGYTVMNIATTSKRLLQITESQMGASRLVEYMTNIGLLVCINEKYQFNAYYAKDNKSKQYAYSYDNEVAIKEYCEKNDINIFEISNYKGRVSFPVTIDSFSKSAVRFNSKLHLLKPDNYSCRDFEDYLTNCLYENYPDLETFQKKADEINAKYYKNDPDRQIRFTPNFTWSKGNKAVTKIGIRSTNSLVSAKTRNITGDEKVLLKKDVLERYGLDLEKDVKSSVPRVTHLMNTGCWLPEDVDMYELIWNVYEELSGDTSIKFSDARDAVKALHMRAVFDSSSMLAAHIKREIKNNDESINDVVSTYRKAVVTVEGDLFDSEIFFHESCIYMIVLEELLKKKFNVWQCYDAFYASKKGVSQEKFETLVTELVAKAAENYYSLNY